MLRRRVLALLGGTALSLMALPAWADGTVSCGSDQRYSPYSGSCAVTLSLSGTPAGPAGRTKTSTYLGKSKSSSPGKTACASRSGSPVPCTSSAGYWSNERQCYVKPATPPPPAGHPLWEGHTDGAVYMCTTGVEAGGHVYSFWSAAQPAGVAAPPDPAVSAKQLVAQMNLRAIDVGMAPEDRPGVVGTVGLPVWMWVENPSAQTFGPQTRSLSERGVTVSASAKVKRVVWQMGDGQAVTCTTAGSVFGPGDGGKSSPDCGHTYSQRGTYTIRATSFWAVDWTASGGQTGSIAMDFTTDRVLEVGEVQVIGR